MITPRVRTYKHSNYNNKINDKSHLTAYQSQTNQNKMPTIDIDESFIQ